MDRIARFFVRRLRQLARREALRNAALHGLLGSWQVDDGRHVLRLYGPAFDTTALTGDIDRDMAWLRRRHGLGSGGSHVSSPDVAVMTTPTPAPALATALAPGKPTPSHRKRAVKAPAIAPTGDFDRHSYAVRLVGALAEPPSVGNIAAALLLARAIAAAGKPLRQTLQMLMRPAPLVSLHAPIAGFERAVTRLIETPGFLPGAALQGIDGDYVFNEKTFDVTDEPVRHYVSFTGENIHRLTGAAMRRRLVNALARNYPVLAITEKRAQIVDEITIAADLELTTGTLDHAFVRSMIEAVYGVDGGRLLAGGLRVYDIHRLSLDDMLLAFRPGREPEEAVEFLIRFAERERAAGKGDDDDDDKPGGKSG